MWKALVVVSSSLLLGACGEDARNGDITEPRAAQGRAAVAAPTETRRGVGSRRRRHRPKASITIIEPAARKVSPGGAVTVSVDVKGFKLVQQRVRPPFPKPLTGRGHVHFYLDTVRLPTRHGPPATGAYRSVSSTSYMWTGLAPGSHSFAVQLVGRDHAPLRPPVKDRVTVAVR